MYQLRTNALRCAMVFTIALLTCIQASAQMFVQDSLGFRTALKLGAQDTFVEVDLMTELKKEAANSQKLIALYFVTPNCPVCKNMEEGTFTSNEVIHTFANRYIFMELCALTNFDGLELAPKFGVEYYPTIVLLNNKGTLVKKLEGYYGAEDLLKELDIKIVNN